MSRLFKTVTKKLARDLHPGDRVQFYKLALCESSFGYNTQDAPELQNRCTIKVTDYVATVQHMWVEGLTNVKFVSEGYVLLVTDQEYDVI